eukprot:CAMPEP_0184309274 /NCGR_PEP_ID=MMETSP1049-20130417/17488_1 /TAXON_ID=77928 /ORGANISM="Proteomonas sulcata, Strain CCMP704" /LENGTH=147 /DNA_ID=CAMNT_0026622135 /DNA_START=32 /DNA_END=475 /DNA_ORIENTATION=+
MRLAFISKIKVLFNPMFDSPSSREFINRVCSPKAQATNPKCEVEIETMPLQLDSTTPPTIDVTFTNGQSTKLQPTRAMKIQEIEKTILEQCADLELAQQFAELKANPVTGPVPIKFWKGRRHTYVDYPEDPDKKKKAAGGVKTIKKK